MPGQYTRHAVAYKLHVIGYITNLCFFEAFPPCEVAVVLANTKGSCMSGFQTTPRDLAEIAQIASMLRTCYPDLARSYQEGKIRREGLWQLSEKYPDNEHIQRQFQHEQEAHDKRVAACDECHRQQGILWHMAVLHIRDGSPLAMPNISFGGRAMYTQPLDEWGGYLHDLAAMESRALLELHQLVSASKEARPVRKKLHVKPSVRKNRRKP